MKKIGQLCLIIFIICCIGLYSNNKLGALANYEFAPAGINWLDPANIVYIPNRTTAGGRIKTISQMKVDPETEYSFYITYYQEIEYGDALVSEYNNSHIKIKDATLQRFEYFNFIKFTTDANTEFITFNIEVANILPAHHDLSLIDELYILTTENNSFQDIQNYILDDGAIPYDGPNMGDYLIVNSTYDINTNISDPIEYEEIRNSLRAYDITDGDISSSIELVSNTYGTSNYQVGTHSIVYQVTNSNNVTTQVTLNIRVKDDIKPVITGSQTYSMYSTNLKTVTDIKNTLTASDNIDGTLTNSITVKTDNFTNRATELGTFDVVYQVIDAEGNVGTFTVAVTVLQGDITPPVFGGTAIFNVTTATPLQLSDILAEVTLSDDWETNIPKSRIVVTTDEYSVNKTKRGTYHIYLSAHDETGNTATHMLTINVKDMEAPIFVINPVVYYVPLQTQMQSIDDIIIALAKTNYIVDGASANIIYENYTENKNTLGDYQLVIECNESYLNVCIKVCEPQPYTILKEKPVEEKINFFQRVGNLFKNMGGRIKSFFGGLFSRLFKK